MLNLNRFGSISRNSFISLVRKQPIDNDKVVVLETAYDCKLPINEKKLVSNMEESVTFTDGSRLLSLEEVMDAKYIYDVDFKSMNLIPLYECADKNLQCFNTKTNAYNRMNLETGDVSDNIYYESLLTALKKTNPINSKMTDLRKSVESNRAISGSDLEEFCDEIDNIIKNLEKGSNPIPSGEVHGPERILYTVSDDAMNKASDKGNTNRYGSMIAELRKLKSTVNSAAKSKKSSTDDKTSKWLFKK